MIDGVAFGMGRMWNAAWFGLGLEPYLAWWVGMLPELGWSRRARKRDASEITSESKQTLVWFNEVGSSNRL